MNDSEVLQQSNTKAGPRLMMMIMAVGSITLAERLLQQNKK